MLTAFGHGFLLGSCGLVLLHISSRYIYVMFTLNVLLWNTSHVIYNQSNCKICNNWCTLLYLFLNMTCNTTFWRRMSVSKKLCDLRSDACSKQAVIEAFYWIDCCSMRRLMCHQVRVRKQNHLMRVRRAVQTLQKGSDLKSPWPIMQGNRNFKSPNST